MGIRIGHASISENGTVNGKKGDQTGREVCIRDFYSKPWDFAAIHPDAAVRERHAAACEAGCRNDNIGYSQYGADNRNTLNTQAAKVGYDLSKIKVPCNTDCSAFQNVCAVASKAPGVTYGSNGWTTSTMKAALTKAGYKIITDKTYLASADYCVRGAIYVKASSHTVCALDNGTKSAQTLAAAGITKPTANNGAGGVKSVDEIAKEVLAGKWGNGDERRKKLAAAGYDYATVQARVTALSKGTALKSVDEIAKEVLAGKWGNGETRRKKLTAAGYDYATVQKRVTELSKKK